MLTTNKSKVGKADENDKIKWFMELAIKMREFGYSDFAIFTSDIDTWDEYRAKYKLTPRQAIVYLHFFIKNEEISYKK